MSSNRLSWQAVSSLTTLLLLCATAAFASGSFVITSISPNPFTPSSGQSTKIYYSVPNTSSYTITIYNSAGAKIDSGSFSKAAGSYNVSWSGKTSSGTIVPNGTYTVKIVGTSSDGTAVAPATSIVTLGSTATPQPATGTYKISSISPNPFNPGSGQSTKIYYSVPTTSTCTITIYNSAGAKITSGSYSKSAGSYNVTWNGKNSSGVVVPNGVYTVKIEGKSSGAAALASATGTVSVGSTTTTPGAYKISGISPNPFNPSSGQSTNISYSVPATSTYTIVVKDSTGTQISQLASYTGRAAGSYTQTWSGKNSSSVVVPDGTYTVVIAGKDSNGMTVTTATSTVTVATNTAPPPPPPPPPSTGGEAGQMVEGAGRANYDWFKNKGYKFSVSFRAPKSGAITEASVPWRTDPGYGAGTYGIFTWELQSNGSNNFPSGTIITKVTGLRPSSQMTAGDSPFTVPITANLTAGQVYHLVMYNTDASPGTNWSSINTVMSRVSSWNPATSPDARGASFNGSSWSPWSSNSDIWNTAGGNSQNGSHMALVLKWSDGTITGDPYWSAAMSNPVYISSSQHGGQVIVWNKPTRTITKVGVPLKGSGTVTYHLESSSGATLAKGTMSGTSSTSAPAWKYATLPTAVTLTQGQTYRLWFEATSQMVQYPPYGPSSPSTWYNVSWGGPQSCVIRRSSGGSWSSTPTQDLSFSLQ